MSNQIHLPQQDHMEKSQRRSQNLGIQPSPHTSSLLLWGTLRGHLSVIDTPSVRRADITRFKWSSFNLYRGDTQGLYFVVMGCFLRFISILFPKFLKCFGSNSLLLSQALAQAMYLTRPSVRTAAGHRESYSRPRFSKELNF